MSSTSGKGQINGSTEEELLASLHAYAYNQQQQQPEVGPSRYLKAAAIHPILLCYQIPLSHQLAHRDHHRPVVAVAVRGQHPYVTASPRASLSKGVEVGISYSREMITAFRSSPDSRP